MSDRYLALRARQIELKDHWNFSELKALNVFQKRGDLTRALRDQGFPAPQDPPEGFSGKVYPAAEVKAWLAARGRRIGR